MVRAEVNLGSKLHPLSTFLALATKINDAHTSPFLGCSLAEILVPNIPNSLVLLFIPTLAFQIIRNKLPSAQFPGFVYKYARLLFIDAAVNIMYNS